MGVAKNIIGELAASHLLALPSYYEGFPNALAEALAVGLPAVAHRGVSGVEELILDGKTGSLVPEDKGTSSLASALSELMSDKARRAQLGNAARHHILRWAPERIFAVWENLLSETAERTRARSEI